MLDCVSLESVATRIACSFHHDTNRTDDKKINYYHPLLAAEELVLTTAMGWTQSIGNRYRDDVTIAFTDLS